MSCVYYIRCGGADGLIKIGKALDPHRRLRQLQTGSGETLTLVATEPGGLGVERMRHRQFRSLRERGEWFRAEPALLRHVEALRAGRRAAQPRLVGMLAWAILRCWAGFPALWMGLLAGWSGELPVSGACAAGRYAGRHIRQWLIYATAVMSRALDRSRVVRRASRE